MKFFFPVLISLFTIVSLYARKQEPEVNGLPVYSSQHQQIDWLLRNSTYKAGVFASADRRELILSNGLVERVFRIIPDVACVSYKNLTTGLEVI